MATKTNAVRMVQRAGFSCREDFYEYDENDLSGLHAAEAIGMPPEQVFKTLVAFFNGGVKGLGHCIAPLFVC